MSKVAEYYMSSYYGNDIDREEAKEETCVRNAKKTPKDETKYVLYTMCNGSRMYYKKGGTVFGNGFIPATALRVVGKNAAGQKAAIMTRNSKNGYVWQIEKA